MKKEKRTAKGNHFRDRRAHRLLSLLVALALLCSTVLDVNIVPEIKAAEQLPEETAPAEPAAEKQQTEAPATEAPKTEAPATEAPKQTEAPATEAPKQTEAPATEAPKQTEAPATEAPKQTEAPATEAPKQTEAPATEAPTEKQTEAPATEAPTEIQTEAPATEAPTEIQTEAPATEAPTELQTEAQTETVTELATESETETEKPEKLQTSVDVKERYGIAGEKKLNFTSKISGGVEPYEVSYQIRVDGRVVFEQKEYKKKFSYMPETFGEHTLTLTVRDADGKTSKAEVSVPVAVSEKENESVWRDTMKHVQLQDDFSEDLVAIAKTQVGYTESTRDFILDDDGKKQGYTRYGHWYGSAYEEWCAMFVSFCLNYAEIPAKYVPREAECNRWKSLLNERGLYVDDEDNYEPEAGDLIFFHHDINGNAGDPNFPNHVGIVTGADGNYVWTIEGNSSKAVREKKYSLSDASIVGYMNMAAAEEKEAKDNGEDTAVITEVKAVVGEVSWLMGLDGDDHEWVSANEAIVKIVTGSDVVAEIQGLTEGDAYVAHSYMLGDDHMMETFHVTVTAAEEEAEAETGTELGTESESETESEFETGLASETEAVAELSYLEIPTDGINLRAEPSADAEILGVAALGEKHELLGEVEAEDGIWYKVNLLAAEPETEMTEAATEFETAAETLPEDETAAPETEAEPETEVPVTIAYVRSDFTDTAAEPEAETESEPELPLLEIPADGINLRAEPSVEAEILGVAALGEKYQLLGEEEAEDGIWYKIHAQAEVLQTAMTENAEQETAAETLPDGTQEETAAPETAMTEEAAVPADETKAPEAGAVPESETETAMTIAYVRSDFTDTAAAKELLYEDEEIIVRVTEVTEGAIPQNAKLQVVPIRRDDAQTAEQYAEVETQLLEKAESEDYEIAGFLAYDITFVDEEGSKLEPNGEVKVSLEYRQPTMPEEAAVALAEMAGEAAAGDAAAEISRAMPMALDTETEAKSDSENVFTLTAEGSEDTEEAPQVTVMHLEENEAGEVAAVVDMSANNQIELLATTEEQKVEKTEFITDSFSTFSLTWKKVGKTVVLCTVDKDGKEIQGFESNYTGTLGNGNNLGDLYKKEVAEGESKSVVDFGDLLIAPKNYYFRHAYIIIKNNKKINITNISYNSGWYYVPEGGGWTKWGNVGSIVKVYLVYEYQELEPLREIDTVDHTLNGVTMRMMNYAAGKDVDQEGIYIGGGYGDGSIKEDLVASKLGSDGYPITTKSGKSLSTLFSGGQQANHLFIKEEYDSSGYYEYSSFDNYAYFTGGNFKVYNHVATPQKGTANYFRRGNFMPYNDIDTTKFVGFVSADKNGNNISTKDPLFLVKGEPDFRFGMYMEADFLQPQGGNVGGNADNPMIYEFTGDDDLWVFIDDALVLDIGGVHDAHSGHINFATGAVVTDSSTTTIKDMFWEARVFPDGSSWTNKNDTRAEEFFEGNTFKDYSTHTMRMFYMERGEGASNLRIRFNLQTIPKNTVMVGKKLTNTDKEKYANVRFGFKIELQKEDPNKEGQYLDEYETYIPKTEEQRVIYNVDAVNTVIGSLVEEDIKEGIVYLKPGQLIKIPDLKANRKYKVSEVDINAQEFDQVVVVGTEVDVTHDDNTTETLFTVDVPEATVGSRPSVIFKNRCSGKNSRELRMTKEIEGLSTPEEKEACVDEFTFKVWLEGQDGKLQPYVGPYYLQDLHGNYWYYDMENGGALTSNEMDSRVCGTTADGTIPKIKAGWTASVTGVLSETAFFVEEVLDETALEYAGSEKNLIKGQVGDKNYDYAQSDAADESGSVKADGQIMLNYDAMVKITNKPCREIEVTKKWSDGNVHGDEDAVYAGLYTKDANGADQPVMIKGSDGIEKHYILTLNKEKNWTDKFTELKLPVNQYVVKELEKNEAGNYTPVENGNVITINNGKYKVDVTPVMSDRSSDPLFGRVTVTNSKPNELHIVKRSAKNPDATLAGAEFTLQKLTGEGAVDQTFTAMTARTNAKGKAMLVDADGKMTEEEAFKNLPDGKYRLTETKAPEGYSQLVEPIVLTLPLTSADTNALADRSLVDVTVNENGGTNVTLTIQNTELYELPSTGGPGTYLFTISGVAMLMTALLLFITNKRRMEGGRK